MLMQSMAFFLKRSVAIGVLGRECRESHFETATAGVLLKALEALKTE